MKTIIIPRKDPVPSRTDGVQLVKGPNSLRITGVPDEYDVLNLMKTPSENQPDLEEIYFLLLKRNDKAIGSIANSENHLDLEEIAFLLRRFRLLIGKSGLLAEADIQRVDLLRRRQISIDYLLHNQKAGLIAFPAGRKRKRKGDDPMNFHHPYDGDLIEVDLSEAEEQQ